MGLVHVFVSPDFVHVSNTGFDVTGAGFTGPGLTGMGAGGLFTTTADGIAEAEAIADAIGSTNFSFE